MRRKINQMTANRGSAGNSVLYPERREQFEFFLNPDSGIADMGVNYIPDAETVSALSKIPRERMDSVTALIGYPGIGKSSDIRYSYKVSNGAPRLCAEDRTVILLGSFSGHIIESGTEESGKKGIRLDLSRRAGAVCEALEKDNPALVDEFYSPKGQEDFLEFLQLTNPKALTDTKDDKRRRTTEEKLETARNNNPFIYVASKIKFYLSRQICEYNRVLLVIDNIEALSEEDQQLLLMQCLRLFSCLRNFPEGWTGKRVYANLLISIRPSTYYRLKKSPVVSFYSIRELYKNKRMDLWSYFKAKTASAKKKFEKDNPDKWKEAGNVIIKLCDKFNRKYAKMIMGLVDMDVRRAMRVLERILSNSVWVTQDACTDKNADTGRDGYVFNNITVIRAISCGSNIVYTNGSDQLIPNILYNTEEEDNSIISMYIIAYFITHNAGFMEYGENPVYIADLIRDFCDVFGKEAGFEDRICQTVDYLYSHGILSLTVLSDGTDHVEVITPSSPLYLSAKGTEIWNMLESDSVLSEMYREDYFQEYSSENPVKFSSSFDLMQQNNQEAIFLDLYRILEHLLTSLEQPMIEAVSRNGAMAKYSSLFGGRTMVEHLMRGINCSVDYSGKKDNRDISERRNTLNQLIDFIMPHI